jgi:hypothetical protein
MPFGSKRESGERQQSLFLPLALPNSLMSTEPNPLAIEIEKKIPKLTLKASFWPTEIGGGGSDHL